MTKCYNCGKSFEKVTKEHIPPRCFSDVYPEEFKKNRITVPCCLKCNKQYAKLDNELRDLISIIKDGKDGNIDFLKKGVNSTLRKKKIGKDFGFDPESGEFLVSIDYYPIEQLFVKCHKGMFYHKYGFPIDEMFESQASQKMINEKHNSAMNDFFEANHRNNPKSLIISGHKEIFEASLFGYKIGAFRKMEITENLDESIVVVSFMIFHDVIDSIVVGIKKGTDFYRSIIAQKPSCPN